MNTTSMRPPLTIVYLSFPDAAELTAKTILATKLNDAVSARISRSSEMPRSL